MRARIALRALQTSYATCGSWFLDDLNLRQLVAAFLEVARLARFRFSEGLFSWTLKSRSIICWLGLHACTSARALSLSHFPFSPWPWPRGVNPRAPMGAHRACPHCITRITNLRRGVCW